MTISTTLIPPDSSNDLSSYSQAEVRLGTLVQFLFGSRSAILTLASRADTFWLGLILVLSAGFAREYGRSDLFMKPWLIAVPLMATIALSLVLFPVAEIVARQRGASGGQFWARLKVFLSLLWMTAPLGWIFMLPVERLMPADDAAIINLWFLGVVMVWRMLLTARILAVLFVPQANELFFTGTTFVVMLVVDTLSLCNLGGDRLVMMVGSDVNAPMADLVVIQVLSATAILGVITWPVWLVGTLAVALWHGSPWSWTVITAPSRQPISKPVQCLAASSLLIWAVLLPIAPRSVRQVTRDEMPQSQQVPETANDDSRSSARH